MVGGDKEKEWDREVRFGLCLLCPSPLLLRQHSVLGLTSLLVPVCVPSHSQHDLSLLHPLPDHWLQQLLVSKKSLRAQERWAVTQISGYHTMPADLMPHMAVPQKIVRGFTSYIPPWDCFCPLVEKRRVGKKGFWDAYASKSLVPASFLPR